MKKIYVLFLLSLLASSMVLCQHPDWKNYTNGKDIRCIFKDGNYLWIGTTGGLVKLDKTTSACIFYTKNNSGLPNLYINAIEKDNAGNLWVGTGGGVVKFDGTVWTTYNIYNSQIECNIIYDLCFDKYGTLWCGSFCGLEKFQNNIWTHYEGPAYKIYGTVEAIAFDTAGILYAGMNNYGITKFDGLAWTNYNTSNSVIQNNRIHDIEVDSNNNVWACSFICGGVGGFTKITGSTISTVLPYTPMQKLNIDSLNHIWFIEYPYGISMYDGIAVTRYDSSNSQVNDVWYDLLEDNGNIWYATRNMTGLKKFDGSFGVTDYNTSKDSISTNFVSSMAVDTSGNVWLSCYPYSGINKFDQTNFTNYNTLNSGLFTDSITSIAVDHSNNIWMGTEYNGLIKYDGTNWIHFDSATYNLPSSRVSTQNPVVFDSYGNTYCNFWPNFDTSSVPIGGGIAKYNGTSWTKINIAAIPDNQIRQLMVDRKNNLWVAGGNNIVVKTDGINTTVFNQFASVTALVCDFNDNVWLSEFNDSIFKIDTNQVVTAYDVIDCSFGPSGDYIRTMSIDVNNNLWIGLNTFCSDSDYVVAKFNGSSFKYYGINNSGLPENYSPVQIINYRNKIYFAGSNGLTEFTDSTITFTEIHSPVLLPEPQISVYPNPTNYKINVSVNLKDNKSVNFTLTDLSGKEIMHQQAEGSVFTQTLDLKNVAAGTYMLNVTIDGKSTVKKVTVE